MMAPIGTTGLSQVASNLMVLEPPRACTLAYYSLEDSCKQLLR